MLWITWSKVLKQILNKNTNEYLPPRNIERNSYLSSFNRAFWWTIDRIFELLSERPGLHTSAVKYSRIAALYTAAVAPTRPWLVVRFFKCLWIRPTGNCKEKQNIDYQGTAEQKHTALLNNMMSTYLKSCSGRTRHSFGLRLRIFASLSACLQIKQANI